MAYNHMPDIEVKRPTCSKKFDRDKTEEDSKACPEIWDLLQPWDFVFVSQIVGQRT